MLRLPELPLSKARLAGIQAQIRRLAAQAAAGVQSGLGPESSHSNAVNTFPQG